MLPRVLEPEVMDTAEDAHDYDTMDHSHVNQVFVSDLLTAMQTWHLANSSSLRIFDAGTGTAQIPIELASRFSSCAIDAADAAEEMLRLAQQNIDRASLSDRIRPIRVDCKAIDCTGPSYDVVMSNTIIHHIPEPGVVFQELIRILSPGGLLFLRDLFRPETEAEVERLVAEYAGDSNPSQRQLFRQSLHAALTIPEVQQLIASFGIPAEAVTATSDRHWTLTWQKPDVT